ncbi:MAG: outer membrane lipid asymmetry maintenance protein MlaD [Alphaproteobacteria bacterium]
MRNNLLEALMGAIVLTIAAIFLGFAYTSSKTNTAGGYHLHASFNRIDGLNVGGDVKLSGVKVGTITKIDIDPQNYQAMATFSVRSDLLIPNDSSAEITSESLLGGKYLALVPGGSEAYLQDGQSVENTQSSLSFEGLISKFLLSQGDAKKETESAEKKVEAKVEAKVDAAAKVDAPQEKAEVATPAEAEAPRAAGAAAEPAEPPVAAITPVVSDNTTTENKDEEVIIQPEKEETPESVSATQ